ncbi:hypothetical protein BV25DRAFT_1832076 [Artomyces pyxidatus]|uniref:Uncharacterized protein n=1 Tax=Artomyces pyxidatus TaxID=48021 RepID=A0ACB8SJJ1_9AGAM|nr:hypothetical protein BV25DRAFT_1832076 [Artomyces pyxidatus]
MSPSDTAQLPSHVYKILSDAPEAPLPHTLPLTPLDAQDGFIHLSTAGRTPITASLYFGSETTLWLLRIDTAAAQKEGAEFRWGDPGCVHLYAGRLGKGIVVGVQEVKRAENGSWEAELGKEEFLSD